MIPGNSKIVVSVIQNCVKLYMYVYKNLILYLKIIFIYRKN